MLALAAEPGLLWGRVQRSCPAAGRFHNGGWLRASCGSLPILAVGLGNGGAERGSKASVVPGVGQDGVAAFTGWGYTLTGASFTDELRTQPLQPAPHRALHNQNPLRDSQQLPQLWGPPSPGDGWRRWRAGAHLVPPGADEAPALPEAG